MKAVLEGHTTATIDRDLTKALSYLAHSSDLAVALAEPGFPRGYDAVAEAYRKSLGSIPKDNSRLTTDGYRFRVAGNTAFVTYREIMTRPDGTAKTYDKANYLEKENGQWKMIGNFWMPETKAAAPDQTMIEDWERAKAYTKEYLDAMPEDGYGFRPTPDIRNFAQ